jgi:septum formation protein
MQVILGSGSKFRRAVFSKIVPDFEMMSPDIDEQAIRDEDPEILTRLIANAKADELLPDITEPSILITADQVVMVNDEMREKPRSEEECKAFLRSYSRQPIRVVNGVVVVNTQTGKRAEGNDTVKLTFQEIPEDVIDTLIEEGDVLHCSGGLKAEHPLLQDSIVSQIGSDESLQGVPVELIKRLMKEVQRNTA